MSASSASLEPIQSSQPGLIGIWYFVSFEIGDGERELFYPLGEHPQGQIIYDKDGNMSCHLLNPDPPPRPTDVTDGVAYEARMSYERYASYYGRYDVDGPTRTVHHHVVGALMPRWGGTTVIRGYVFDGDDKLTLTAETGVGNQQAILIWQRAK